MKRRDNKWAFTKFDILDRAIITGTNRSNSQTTCAAMETFVDTYLGVETEKPVKLFVTEKTCTGGFTRCKRTNEIHSWRHTRVGGNFHANATELSTTGRAFTV